MSEAPPSAAEASGAKGPDPLIGRVVNDRYKIVSVIARGGMGKVYRAEQAPLGRQVALKVLNPSYQGDNDPEFHKRFFLEASICAKLTHPNTVTIFDYGRTDDEIYYIAMELLEGRTLHRALRDEAPFAPERAIHITRQICRSLREAHSMGVIHRDLKPANVYLVRHGDESDFAKVLDFGLVKDLEKEGEDLTQTGLFMGSPKYMSPEQIRGEKVDGRCDVYAMGVILYEMLTGKVPFDRPNSVNILMAHVHEAVPSMNDMAPGMVFSPQLQAVVMKAMAKKQSERYASMDELIVALKEVSSGGAMVSRSTELSDSSMTGLDSHSGSYSLSGSGEILSSTEGTVSASWAAPIQPAAAEQTDSGKGKIIAVAVIGLAVVAGAALAVIGGRSPESPPSPPPVVASAPAATPPSVPEPPPPDPAAVAAAGTVAVELHSTPEGAKVFVGDRELGVTPLSMEWNGADAVPGREVTFQFRLDGFRDFTITRVVSGDALSVAASLEAVATTTVNTRRPIRRPSGEMSSGNSSSGNHTGYKIEPY